MESKKLIIDFVWTFVLAAVVLVFLEEGGMSFVGYMVFFFVALASTLAVETLIPDKGRSGSELLSEVRELRSRLDEIAKGSG
jgi:hypothetical protein